MTEGDSAAEFDDEEHQTAGPLLPPDDRLWRHPSEIASEGLASALDPAAVRTRWLEREPTRATAWTAGLVGALLATGIVLVGTHLATFLTKPPVSLTDASSVVPATTGTTTPEAPARGYGLGAALNSAVTRVGDETVTIHAFRGSTPVESLGLVITADGMVVVAAGAVRGATSILVDPPRGGPPFVATVSGVDARSGLAILHVNRLPVTGTAIAGAGAESEMAHAAFVIAITSAGGTTYAPASLTSVDIAPKVDGTQMVDAATIDLPAAYAPLGSPVLDGAGKLIGIVVGAANGHVVLTPAWILDPVAAELNDLGAVAQGWMGINGTTMTTSVAGVATPGVHVLAVTPASAAAKAGIGPGDEITSIDGLAVTSITALQGRLHTERPGTVISVGLFKHNRAETVDVTLAASHS